MSCGCEGVKCRLEVGDSRHGTLGGYGNHYCRCTPCKTVKSGNAREYRAKNRDKIQEYDSRYRKAHPEEVRKWRREFERRDKSLNPEKYKEKSRRYRNSAAYRQRIVTMRESRPEHAKQKTSQRVERALRYAGLPSDVVRRMYRVEYYSSELGKAFRTEYRHRRRALEKSSVCGCVSPTLLVNFHSSTMDGCAYCHSGLGTTLDHVVPLSTGGWHCVANLLPACQSCNSSKNKSELSEWLTRTGRTLQYTGPLLTCPNGRPPSVDLSALVC